MIVKAKEMGVNQICKTLEISKYCYYYSKDKKSTLNNKYRFLKPKIEKIIERNPAYGYPRLKKALKDKFDLTVNHKLLIKLLKLWGLGLRRKIKKRKKSLIQNILKYLESRANILRQVKVKSCFKAIVSDVTMIKYQGGIAYLCVHLDYYGKMVYGFKLGLSPDTNLVIASLRSAVSRLRKFKIKDLKKLIFHQDRGSVYTSYDYTAEILKHGSYLSYSKRGQPGDNAVNESFFSRLKEEWRDVFYEARDFWELEKIVKEKIKYYNNERYHSSLNQITPLRYIKKFLIKN
jgi:putative transposase